MKIILKPLSKHIRDGFSIECEDKKRVTVGRKEENDLILPFRNVSSYHALLECENGVLYVEDLNSTNGTFINGKKVETREPLGNGDTLRFATYEFLIEIEDKKSEPPQTNQSIQPEGTVLMDASKLEELKKVVETVPKKQEKPEKNVGGETVLYGVKDLVQHGRLVLLDEKGKFVEEFELDSSEVSIGRDSENNIPVDHPSISRIHCFITRKEEFYEIKDNDSTNGVLVNGKKVKKAILNNGDIIKLGDKEFVFIAPGELFSPSFLNKRSKSGSFSFDKKKVYISLGIVFLVLIIILALLPSPRGQRTARQQISQKELKTEIINSYENEDWDNVIYLIENFKIKGFDKEYVKAKFEIENRKPFLDFSAALDRNDFEKARQLLSLINPDSVYRKKAEQLYSDKSEQYITSNFEEIDSFLDAGKIPEAKEIADKLKAVFPDNPKVVEIAEQVNDKYNLYMRKKAVRAKYAALRRKLKRQSAALENKAKELYLQGKIVDAISKLIDARQLYIANNLKVPARIERLKDALGEVRKLYLSGKKKVMEGNLDSAALDFEKLFAISEKRLWGIDGSVEKECKTLLSDYYAKKAEQYFASNNFTKALGFAEKVLDIDPSNRRMSSLKREIIKNARDLYNKGYIEQTQYNDCKAALFYFRQVIDILPPSDPVYKKAVKRIKECEK